MASCLSSEHPSRIGSTTPRGALFATVWAKSAMYPAFHRPSAIIGTSTQMSNVTTNRTCFSIRIPFRRSARGRGRSSEASFLRAPLEFLFRDWLPIDSEVAQARHELLTGVWRRSRCDVFTAQPAFGVPDFVQFAIPVLHAVNHPDERRHFIRELRIVAGRRLPVRAPSVFLPLRVNE